MNQQIPSTTPYSVALRLTGYALSTTTMDNGDWRIQLQLLLWRQQRVCITTFEFVMEPKSEIVAFLEHTLTLGVTGELPLLPLLRTLRELSTGWHAVAQSLKFPRIGWRSTLRQSSLDTAKSIVAAEASARSDGSQRRSRSSVPKAGATTRSRRSRAIS